MTFAFSRTLMLVFPLVALVSGASWAQSQVGSAPKSEIPAVEKKICRRQAATGSIMPAKRICKSKAEWATIDQNNQTGLERSRGPASAPAGTPQT
jgi:hypothetical protein